MITYDRVLQVTENEFNSCQEDIKTAVRKIVDRHQNSLIEIFPSTRVEFLTSMKGNKIEEVYKFNFVREKKEKKEKIEEVYAELSVHIQVIKETEE